MADEPVMVRVAENGRLSIPARQRKLLGIENGGVMVATVSGGELRLRPVRTVVSERQDEVARYLSGSGEGVERFIAERRIEAKNETAEPGIRSLPSGLAQ
jgi:AbrB family looped-hinge helix DNA binding protein